MPASANLSFPEHGWRPDLWYFFITAQATVYFPSRADFNTAFSAVGIPDHIEQMGPFDGPDDGEILPLVKVVIWQNFVMVVIQGSTGPDQLWRQIRPEFQSPYLPSGGRVSNFYLSRGTALYNEIRQYVTAFNYPGKKLVLVGHSYGAALATVMAPWFERDYPGFLEGVMAFASTRAGDHLFADNYPVRLLNVGAEGDRISAFPPNATGPLPLFVRSSGLGPPFNQWAHAGERFLLNADGTCVNLDANVTWESLDRSVAESIDRPLFLNVDFHYPGHYAACIRRNIAFDVEVAKARNGIAVGLLDRMNIGMAQAFGSEFRVSGL